MMYRYFERAKWFFVQFFFKKKENDYIGNRYYWKYIYYINYIIIWTKYDYTLYIILFQFKLCKIKKIIVHISICHENNII